MGDEKRVEKLEKWRKKIVSLQTMKPFLKREDQGVIWGQH